MDKRKSLERRPRQIFYLQDVVKQGDLPAFACCPGLGKRNNRCFGRQDPQSIQSASRHPH
jgi:hypothetical protein